MKQDFESGPGGDQKNIVIKNNVHTSNLPPVCNASGLQNKSLYLQV